TSLDAGASMQRGSELLVREFADWGTRGLADEAGEWARAAAAAGKTRAHPSAEPGDHAREVILSGTKLVIGALEEQNVYRSEFPDDTASVLSLPVRGRGRPLGVLTCGRVEPAYPFGADDVALLDDLVARIGTAADPARRYRGVQERAEAARVLTYVADGVLLVDRAGIVRLWNPAAEKVTGIPAADLVGRPAADHIGGWREALESLPWAPP